MCVWRHSVATHVTLAFGYLDSVIVVGSMETSKNSNFDATQKPRKNAQTEEQARIQELRLNFDLVGIGIIETVFNKKNATPRQSGLCPESKGIVHLHKRLFDNPMHALDGIDQFQYVW